MTESSHSKQRKSLGDEKGFSPSHKLIQLIAVFDQITILAPGLLGASVAWAAHQRQLARCIHVWARRDETRQQCASLPWCNAVHETAQEAVRGADFIILAPPVDVIPELLRQIKTCCQPGALVTDVGSTKSQICRAASEIFPPGVHFIGSHPMAGSEKNGLGYADANLFVGRACIVTPIAATPSDPLNRLMQFWRALDMYVVTMPPADHDQSVANISHLPHLLASVLAAYLARNPMEWRSLAGNGLRDVTRIASGSPELWLSILNQNRQEVLQALRQFKQQLHIFEQALTECDDAAILQLLQIGKSFRDSL